MKLNKKILKSLIVESIEEMSVSRDDRTGTAYDDVTHGREAEPRPEDFGIYDVADYFAQVGEDLQNHIDMIENMPRIGTDLAMTPEDVTAALNEMDRVQKEIEEIKGMLKDLEKRDMRGEE